VYSQKGLIGSVKGTTVRSFNSTFLSHARTIFSYSLDCTVHTHEQKALQRNATPPHSFPSENYHTKVLDGCSLEISIKLNKNWLLLGRIFSHAHCSSFVNHQELENYSVLQNCSSNFPSLQIFFGGQEIFGLNKVIAGPTTSNINCSRCFKIGVKR